jgi:hypothetical protein
MLLEPAVIGVVPAQMGCHHMAHGPQVTSARFLPHDDEKPYHLFLPHLARAEGAQMLLLLEAGWHG